MAAIQKWVKFKVHNELFTIQKIAHISRRIEPGYGVSPFDDPTTTLYAACKLTFVVEEEQPFLYLWLPLLDDTYETALLAGDYIPVTDDWSVEETFDLANEIDINVSIGEIVSGNSDLLMPIYGKAYYEHFWNDPSIGSFTYDAISTEYGDMLSIDGIDGSNVFLNLETEQFLICDEGGTNGPQIITQFGGILGTQQKVGE